MESIMEYIKRKYDPLSIILYGSYANGTNNLNSLDSLENWVAYLSNLNSLIHRRE